MERSVLWCGAGAAFGPSFGECERPDQTILHLKTEGRVPQPCDHSKLGLSEKAIRKRLRRPGWQHQPELDLSFRQERAGDASPTTEVSEHSIDIPEGGATADSQWQPGRNADREPAPVSQDLNPLDRSMDRLLAAMGLIEDAAPLFAHAESLPRAGVLVAIPPLVGSAVVSVSRKICVFRPSYLDPFSW